MPQERLCAVCGAGVPTVYHKYCSKTCRHKAQYARLVSDPERFARYQNWRADHLDNIRVSSRRSQVRRAAKGRLQLASGQKPELAMTDVQRITELRRTLSRALKQQQPVQLTHDAQATILLALNVAECVL